MNLFLCLDTIGPDAGVTLIKDSEVRHEPIDPMQASEKLLESIDEILTGTKSKSSDLEGILIIKGPGSFTGLRVGIAIANQFAHQLKIPIVGLTANEWWQHRTEEKDFLYLQTMNRGEVYASGFGKLQQPEFPSILSIEALTERVNHATGQIKWLGTLSGEHQKELSSRFEKVGKLDSIKNNWIKAAASIKWQNYQDYQLVEPFYGKAPNITSAKKHPLL